MRTFCTTCIDLKSLQSHLTLRKEDIPFWWWASWWRPSVLCVRRRKKKGRAYFSYTFYPLPSWGSRGALLGTGVQPATTAVHNFTQQSIRSWSMTEQHTLHSSSLWIFPRDYHIPLKAKCHCTISWECVHAPHNWQVGISQRVWSLVDPCLNHYELLPFLSQETETDTDNVVETHLHPCDYITIQTGLCTLKLAERTWYHL